MEDHLDFSPVFEISIRNGVGATSDPTTSGPLIDEYRTNRTGPFTNAGVDYIGWEKLPDVYRANLSAAALADLARFPSDWPEVRRLRFTLTIIAQVESLRRVTGRVRNHCCVPVRKRSQQTIWHHRHCPRDSVLARIRQHNIQIDTRPSSCQPKSPLTSY